MAVSAGGGKVGGAEVSLGFARTGVDVGSGEAVGRGGAMVVAITAVGVAIPGIGILNEHAPRRSRATKAGKIFFMASPLSTRID